MKHLIFLIFFLTSFLLNAQFVDEKKEAQDTAYSIPMINLSYAYQWTASDMKSRFSSNSNVGGSFMVKTKKNWVFGFKGNFIWGGEVNDQEVLRNITTSDGFVIDNEGRLTDVYLGERGSSFFLIGGRIINKLAPNKNSGFLVYGGIGMLQHKISIKFQDDIVALSDEHKKGYDRYSIGYAFNGFAGYMYLSKNRLVNFFGGFDYTHGWTKSLRKFNYDTEEYDNDTNMNILYGIRVGWIIRLNKRQSQEFYYY